MHQSPPRIFRFLGIPLPKETILAAAAVLIFSGTMPATRIAVQDINPWIVSMGRTIAAGCVCAAILIFQRKKMIEARYLPALLRVSFGALIGFPLLSSLGLQHVPATHGSAIVGFVPAATTTFASLRSRQWPGWRVALGSVLGALSVAAFALHSGGGRLQTADIYLLLSIVSAAFGYVEGGRLAKSIGGWNTICWGLIVSIPAASLILAVSGHTGLGHPTLEAATAFCYISFGSLLFGMFLWYKALSGGNMAKVAQIQLMQPVISVIISCWILREHLSRSIFITIIAVLSCTLLTQTSSMTRREKT